jgi:hypothetical protein
VCILQIAIFRGQLDGAGDRFHEFRTALMKTFEKVTYLYGRLSLISDEKMICDELPSSDFLRYMKTLKASDDEISAMFYVWNVLTFTAWVEQRVQFQAHLVRFEPFSMQIAHIDHQPSIPAQLPHAHNHRRPKCNAPDNIRGSTSANSSRINGCERCLRALRPCTCTLAMKHGV